MQRCNHQDSLERGFSDVDAARVSSYGMLLIIPYGMSGATSSELSGMLAPGLAHGTQGCTRPHIHQPPASEASCFLVLDFRVVTDTFVHVPTVTRPNLTRNRRESSRGVGPMLLLRPTVLTPTWYRQHYGTRCCMAMISAASLPDLMRMVAFATPRYLPDSFQNDCRPCTCCARMSVIPPRHVALWGRVHIQRVQMLTVESMKTKPIAIDFGVHSAVGSSSVTLLVAEA
eukprot:3068389-Rhodomonas_salina.1